MPMWCKQGGYIKTGTEVLSRQILRVGDGFSQSLRITACLPIGIA